MCDKLTMLCDLKRTDPNILNGYRSPFSRGGGGFTKGRISGGFSESESDISFISSDRASTDRASSVMYEYIDQGRGGRISTSSDHSFGSVRMTPRFDLNAMNEFSMVSQDTSLTSSSWSSQNLVRT